MRRTRVLFMSLLVGVLVGAAAWYAVSLVMLLVDRVFGLL